MLLKLQRYRQKFLGGYRHFHNDPTEAPKHLNLCPSQGRLFLGTVTQGVGSQEMIWEIGEDHIHIMQNVSAPPALLRTIISVSKFAKNLLKSYICFPLIHISPDNRL